MPNLQFYLFKGSRRGEACLQGPVQKIHLTDDATGAQGVQVYFFFTGLTKYSHLAFDNLVDGDAEVEGGGTNCRGPPRATERSNTAAGRSGTL